MPYVFDQRRRDNILKNGYTEKKLQQIGTDFDAIVIGSGIGGLVAASLLARTGKRVLILEQHDQIGGCCHSFRENGFEFDTGIHYIGEMRNNTAFRFLLDQISNGQLSWADVCDDFDTVVLVDDDGDCANGLRKVVEAVEQGQMLKAFPDEKAAIDRYFELIEETRKSMRGFVGMKAMPAWLGSLLVNTGLVSFYTDYFLKAQKSVTEVIGSVTENTALRAVLSYNFGDYGTIPKDAPFGMHAALQNHFLHGVSFPVGGSSQIGFTIVPTILEAGGAAFVRAEVESIVTDSTGSVATGVKMKRDGNIISAPIIISDAGLFNTVTKLLSPSAAPKLDSMMRHVRHGTGGLSVYVGLKGTAAALGIEGKHYWAMWTKS
ncbi:retsat, partial [Symbiodinium microadriaticum]